MHLFSLNSILSQTPEYFFGNIAFILLFIAVLLYWFDFSDTSTTAFYSTSTSTKQANQPKSFFAAQRQWKNICMIGANVSLALLLIIRWFESGHFPLSNLYESLIGLSWGFTTVHLIVVSVLVLDVLDLTKVLPTFFSFFSAKKDKLVSVPNLTSNAQNISGATEQQVIRKRNSNLLCNYDSHPVDTTNQPYLQFTDKIGAITAPTALLTSVFATFFLPPEMVRATALIPALKSNWLTMHVTVMVASYAFLLVGSLLSITFCVYRFIIIMRKPESFSLLTFYGKPSQYIDSNVKDVCIWLNTMSYRILGLGFPLLTVGILSGAVWANEAWGSYWSWDPKETWALITWLVFAVYFHSRYTRNSDMSPVPASIASIGFVTIWICYLGVNLIGTGLHSYGWFVS